MTTGANPKRSSNKRNQQGQKVSKRTPSWTSLPSWLALVVALSANLISVGYTYADFAAKLERNRDEINRNEREDRERASRFEDSIRQINMTLANLGQLRTDVEVVKTSLTSINETLRRLERKLEVPSSAIMVKPDKQ